MTGMGKTGIDLARVLSMIYCLFLVKRGLVVQHLFDSHNRKVLRVPPGPV